MKTIAENLRILKDSTDAIKLAIIDKGGTVTGGLSSYAEAINKLDVNNKEVINVYCSSISNYAIAPGNILGDIFVSFEKPLEEPLQVILYYSNNEISDITSRNLQINASECTFSNLEIPENYLHSFYNIIITPLLTLYLNNELKYNYKIHYN